jgi:hypothetical protein
MCELQEEVRAIPAAHSGITEPPKNLKAFTNTTITY